jgi:stearoyl-CoA desaturase (delta-9 desaturase)
VRWGEIKHFCDTELLHAVITHRYDVLTRYARAIRTITRQELARLGGNIPDRKQVMRWLNLDKADLKTEERDSLARVLAGSERLKQVYQMRQELAAIWGRSSATREQLVFQLQDWCRKAEGSGIDALSQFSLRLRRYA